MTKERLITTKIGELVLDYGIYPRTDIDSTHIHYMREAEQAGVKLPPMIIEAKTKRIVDGVHRYRMLRSEYGDDYKIKVIAKAYPNEKELLLDAIRRNSHHGRLLTRHDRVHAVLLSEKLKIEPNEIAEALCMTVEKLGELRTERIGELKVGKTVQEIPIKRTIRHMSGKVLTKAQYQANDHLSGMNQSFYITQLLLLIDNGLVDTKDEKLMDKLRQLHMALGKILVVKGKAKTG